MLTGLEDIADFMSQEILENNNTNETTTTSPLHDIYDQHIGDILVEQKPPGTVRIYCINLNGLKWDQDGGNWPEVCQAMEACNAPDIIGLVELNQDVGRYNLQKKINSVCQAIFQQHHLIMSTSSHKVCRTYKPGGTAALLCNNITSLVSSWKRDRMGRWSAVRLSGADGKYITYIIAYQVCTTISKGTNTAAAQQRATIMAESIAANLMERISPRKAFIRDLQQFIKAAQAEGDSVILSGDFNETMTETNSGMAALAAECGLIDLFSIRLSNADNPVTYQRGRKRLDYILMSPNLVHSVQAAGYDPFGYRIVSDHRGYFIDLEAERIFGSTPAQLASHQHRDFSSRDPKAMG